ncbi:MAG: hypothetical protein DSM106950_02435 [Stigonema ocellatum SAG 48.90 = DSM 106950]|nr:hypothetical protein [Stigonema ocellatum SAG 48.90 = DSM 106950]
MTKPNFEQMSKSELKTYLREHPDDNQAFHALMDKIKAQPSSEIYSIEDIDRLEDLIKARHLS